MIGSGKSFVCRLLQQKGYPVLDADKQVHDLYRSCLPLRERIAEEFGPESLTLDGVNRAFFSNLIFQNNSARIQLENLVYPYLTESVRSFFVKYPNETCFLEAAVLSRSSSIVEMLDAIWVVKTDERCQKQRLLDRGMTENEIANRIQNQQGMLQELQKFGKNLRFIDNSGEKEDVYLQLSELLTFMGA